MPGSRDHVMWSRILIAKTQPYAYDNLEIDGNPMISWLAFGAPKQIRFFGAAPGQKICVKT